MIRAIIAAAAILCAAGCGSAGPIEGPDLERLRADVRSAPNEALTVVRVGPRALGAGGNEALVVMPFEHHGTKVADFTLYDGYFKVGFALVEELRDLGVRAALDTRLWAARMESVAFEQRGLDDKAVEVALAHVGAYEEIEQIYRLDPVEKRKLLLNRTVLLAARSALPASLRAKGAKVTGREIRDKYFVEDGARPTALMLSVEAIELSCVSEQGTLGGERRGKATMRFELSSLRHSSAAPRVAAEISCEAKAEGSAVQLDPARAAAYEFQLTADEPLDRAIRGCIREFVKRALPELRARK